MTIRLNPRKKILPTALTVLLLASVGGASTAHAGSKKVIVESVNVFTSNPSDTSCGAPNICNSISNGNGFYNGILTGGWFQAGGNWTNFNVWDTDFHDPQLTSNANDHDNAYFDSVGYSLSYVTAHGSIGGATHVGCNHDNECNSPPSGMLMPGFCSSYPGYQTDVPTTKAGRCVYNTKRLLLVNPFVASNQHSGNIDYSANGSNGPKLVSWGESVPSGSWAGAGTNGGTNLIISDQSFGTEPGLWFYQMYSALAGAHLFGTCMPTAGDTANVATRGSAFAQAFVVNGSSAIGPAWANVVSQITEGVGCAGAGTVAGGYNGCGCNVIIAANTSSSGASWSTHTENWWDVQEDAYDSKGNSSYNALMACNYNTNTYPLTHP